MKRAVRLRFWLESGLAIVTGCLAILTVFWRDWIEALTGFDPDHHSGSWEWAIIGGLAVTCILVAVVARAEWRRSPAAVAAQSG